MNEILLISLDLAVPLHILDMRGMDPEARRGLARDAADTIASRADVMMFGGKKGEAKEVFNVLARALAAASFQPGGVKFCGRHWMGEDA